MLKKHKIQEIKEGKILENPQNKTLPLHISESDRTFQQTIKERETEHKLVSGHKFSFDRTEVVSIIAPLAADDNHQGY